VLVSRRPGALTAWGNAYLEGSTSLDAAVEHVTGDDPLHRVTGVPGEPGAVSLAVALGRLRAEGVQALRLVLPEPGDPTGLPGPAAVTTSALGAGCAVLTVGPRDVAAYAVLPTSASASAGDGEVVRWDVVEVAHSTPPHGLPTLSEADRALTEALADTTGALDALDVARGRDEIAPRLAALDRALRSIDLPASLPARAQRTVATSSRLLGVLGLATETDGGAVTAAEAQQRLVALRPLRTAVRYALCAAYSAAAEPARPAR
jgi:hypothetical protein